MHSKMSHFNRDWKIVEKGAQWFISVNMNLPISFFINQTSYVLFVSDKVLIKLFIYHPFKVYWFSWIYSIQSHCVGDLSYSIKLK